MAIVSLRSLFSFLAVEMIIVFAVISITSVWKSTIVRPVPESCSFDNKKQDYSRYISTLFFYDQLTVAQAHLIDLIQVGKLLGAQTVAPLTCDSRVCGIAGKYCQCHYAVRNEQPSCDTQPNVHGRICSSDVSVLSLYSETFLQSQLQASHLPPLSNLTSFIKYSHRSIVILHPFYQSRSYTDRYDGIGGKTVTPLLQNKSIVDCRYVKEISKLSDKVLTDLNHLAFKYEVDKFDVVAVYCIRSWEPYNAINLMSEWKLEKNTSVIMTAWRGLAKNNPVSLRLTNISRISISMMSTFSTGFVASDQVLIHAEQYLDDVTMTKPFVCIHMRIEYLRINNFTAIKNCFLQIRETRNHFLTLNSNLTVLHFWDLGHWGTSSFRDPDGKKTKLKKFIERKFLQISKYKINEYDPIKYHGIKDGGFVSLVEAEVMSKAEHLITVGGGTFQKKVITKFLLKKATQKLKPHRLNHCKMPHFIFSSMI